MHRAQNAELMYPNKIYFFVYHVGYLYAKNAKKDIIQLIIKFHFYKKILYAYFIKKLLALFVINAIKIYALIVFLKSIFNIKKI